MSTFSAQVVSGRGRGRKQGFPTLNLCVGEGFVPEEGVYAVRVALGREGDFYPAVMHVGARPTFEDAEPAVEVHLVRFEGEPRAENVRVEVLGRLRDVRRFDSPEALKLQIEADIVAAENLW